MSRMSMSLVTVDGSTEDSELHRSLRWILPWGWTLSITMTMERKKEGNGTGRNFCKHTFWQIFCEERNKIQLEEAMRIARLHVKVLSPFCTWLLVAEEFVYWVPRRDQSEDLKSASTPWNRIVDWPEISVWNLTDSTVTNRCLKKKLLVGFH